jgi:hypothetical protein
VHLTLQPLPLPLQSVSFGADFFEAAPTLLEVRLRTRRNRVDGSYEGERRE